MEGNPPTPGSGDGMMFFDVSELLSLLTWTLAFVSIGLLVSGGWCGPVALRWLTLSFLGLNAIVLVEYH